jgi:hypothetical protein
VHAQRKLISDKALALSMALDKKMTFSDQW